MDHLPPAVPAQLGMDARRAVNPALGREDAADVPALSLAPAFWLARKFTWAGQAPGAGVAWRADLNRCI